jgi:hypothetical protein
MVAARYPAESGRFELRGLQGSMEPSRARVQLLVADPLRCVLIQSTAESTSSSRIVLDTSLSTNSRICCMKLS